MGNLDFLRIYFGISISFKSEFIFKFLGLGIFIINSRQYKQTSLAVL